MSLLKSHCFGICCQQCPVPDTSGGRNLAPEPSSMCIPALGDAFLPCQRPTPPPPNSLDLMSRTASVILILLFNFYNGTSGSSLLRQDPNILGAVWKHKQTASRKGCWIQKRDEIPSCWDICFTKEKQKHMQME